MTKEELIKSQFPNDEFLQAGVSQIVDKCTAELEEKLATAKDYIKRLLNQELSTDEWAELAMDAANFIQ